LSNAIAVCVFGATTLADNNQPCAQPHSEFRSNKQKTSTLSEPVELA